MSADIFRHVGGAVVGDRGALSLAQARVLVRFYSREALHCHAGGERGGTLICARRALALHAAVTEATRWRRAAGWSDPDGADPVGPAPSPRNQGHRAENRHRNLRISCGD